MAGLSPYHPPVKRSLTIAGHETSVSLEPVFWAALSAAAEAESLPLNALVARIDAERLTVVRAPNLASALRGWLMVTAQQQSSDRLRLTDRPELAGGRAT